MRLNMTHGSLFSGIGGFDLAASWAGIETLFHCEWNPFCRRVLKHHFPNAESYEDITKTDFTKWRGRIDILSGGFPCQPFSLAGSRNGADDDRYLWPEMLRAIEEIRPTWVIGENVAGILSMVLPGEEIKVGSFTDIAGESYEYSKMYQQSVIDRICEDFERVGYSVQPVIIPACAVGAPHRRDRIWFIAHRSDTRNENMREREKQTYTVGFASDSHVERCNDRKHSRRERCVCDNEKRDATQNQSERDKWQCGVGSVRSAVANSESTRIKGECENQSKEREFDGRSCKDMPADWTSFPTQSPVCDRDDGLPFGLAGISFSKWRQESIKAMGNAIVPQVAYEIFKFIKQIEDEEYNIQNTIAADFRDMFIVWLDYDYRKS